MKSEFKMKDLGPINNILGIHIQRDGTGKIHLSQEICRRINCKIQHAK
jgi:hypothetical protein